MTPKSSTLFFYNNRYLHCVRPYCENIFEFVYVILEKSRKKNLIIWNTVPHFNPRLFTTSVSAVLILQEQLLISPWHGFYLINMESCSLLCFTRIFVKTISTKYYVSYAKGFCDSAKANVFLRFHDGRRNIFMNANEEFFLCF